MTLRGEKVAEVAELLAKFRQQEESLRQLARIEGADFNLVPSDKSLALVVTYREVEGILRARAAETARLLENIGIKLELPA